ncbi:hypothetical protein MCUN1_001055 [Malassezia cuniculi]|uniref:Mitochondrial dicarboxylate transporter n=1 Tax=Malassezia cuniculi TaxID=948313 RepID=A0AAF0EP22_9BASI|nr:hypothetical protein MCUN1_001055 [Malassezia cuniculi]
MAHDAAAQTVATPAPKLAQQPKPYPFYLGGVAASIAVLFTHPLDYAKLRLQNSPNKSSTVQVIRSTIAQEGFGALYTGIAASVLRQMTYSLTRFAAYDKLKGYMLQQTGAKPSLSTTIIAAGLAGAAGGIAGNPADIILVRMTGDSFRPPEQRFNYRGPISGLVRVVREEGAGALFRGAGPNTIRAALMNSSQLASYDLFKDMLRRSGYVQDGSLPHYLCASLLSGTVATTICSPADVLRARIMNSRSSSSIPTILHNALRTEGVAFLFRGWVPSWMRLAPQTVILLTVLEKLREFVDMTRALKEKS